MGQLKVEGLDLPVEIAGSTPTPEEHAFIMQMLAARSAAPAPPPSAAQTPPTAPPPADTSPGAGRAALERSGDPRFATPAPKEEPSYLQKFSSPLVHGANNLAGMPNLFATVVSYPFQKAAEYVHPPTGKALADVRDSWMSNTGDNGPVLRGARAVGLTPEDVSWRPNDAVGRALHNSTDLMTQIVGGGALSRLYGAVKPLFGASAPITSVPKSGFVSAPAPQFATQHGGKDVASATVGGTAQEAAHSAGASPATEGQFTALGALAPYFTPQGFFRNLVSPRNSTLAGKNLAKELDSTPERLLRQFDDANSGIPDINGWTPTPGGITGNSTLLQKERTAADSQKSIPDPGYPGAKVTPAELRQRGDNVVMDATREAAPEGIPLAMTTEAQERLRLIREDAAKRAAEQEARAARLEAQAQSSAETAASSLPPIAHGERTSARSASAQQFHGQLEKAETASETAGGKLFDAVDPDKTARVPMYPLRDALEEVRDLAVREGRLDALPKAMRKPTTAEGEVVGDQIDDFLRNASPVEPNPQFLANVPFERVKGLRSRLTTEQRMATDPKEREYYGRLISGLDNAVANEPTGLLAGRYATARDFWRDNVAKPYREGTVADILRKDKDFTGAGTLMAGGERGAQNMKQLADQVRSNPDLARATRDFAHTDMATYATDINGRVNGTKLREWVDKHGPMLDHFPDLKEEFSKIATAQRIADKHAAYAATQSPQLRALAAQGIKNTEEQIRHSAARFYLNGEPDAVISGILAAKKGERAKLAADARGMLGSDEARDGMARAYWDNLSKRVLDEKGSMVNGRWKSALSKALDQEGDVARRLLPPEVVTRLKQMETANAINTARDRAAANAGPTTAERQSGKLAQIAAGTGRHILLPLLVAGGGTATGNALAGVIGAVAIEGLSLTRGMRKSAEQAAIREILFDPKLYREAMNNAVLSNASQERMRKTLTPYLMATGGR